MYRLKRFLVMGSLVALVGCSTGTDTRDNSKGSVDSSTSSITDSSVVTPSVPALATDNSPVDSSPPNSSSAATSVNLLNEFRRIELSGGDQVAVQQAADQLVVNCMAESGIDRQPPDYLDYGTLDQINAELAQIPTIDEIRVSGYAWKSARLKQLANSPTASSSERPVVDQELLESCSQRASDELGLDEWADLMNQVAQAHADARDRVRTLDKYLAAQQAWSGCMKQSGYPLDNLDHAESIEAYDANGELDDGLLAMAVRDFECRFEHHVYEIENQLLNTEAQLWLEANPDIANRIEQLRSELLAATVASN